MACAEEEKNSYIKKKKSIEFEKFKLLWKANQILGPDIEGYLKIKANR